MGVAYKNLCAKLDFAQMPQMRRSRFGFDYECGAFCSDLIKDEFKQIRFIGSIGCLILNVANISFVEHHYVGFSSLFLFTWDFPGWFYRIFLCLHSDQTVDQSHGCVAAEMPTDRLQPNGVRDNEVSDNEVMGQSSRNFQHHPTSLPSSSPLPLSGAGIFSFFSFFGSGTDPISLLILLFFLGCSDAPQKTLVSCFKVDQDKVFVLLFMPAICFLN